MYLTYLHKLNLYLLMNRLINLNNKDIFMPFCDGDLIFELRLLAEVERIYQPDILVNIATNNMGFT